MLTKSASQTASEVNWADDYSEAGLGPGPPVPTRTPSRPGNIVQVNRASDDRDRDGSLSNIVTVTVTEPRTRSAPGAECLGCGHGPGRGGPPAFTVSFVGSGLAGTQPATLSLLTDRTRCRPGSDTGFRV